MKRNGMKPQDIDPEQYAQLIAAPGHIQTGELGAGTLSPARRLAWARCVASFMVAGHFCHANPALAAKRRAKRDAEHTQSVIRVRK
jgi:hypothetical protein